VRSAYDDAQNVNFAIPIEYAKVLLTITGTRPLMAIYEPRLASGDTVPSSLQSTAPRSESKASVEPASQSQPSIDGSWSATFADNKASGKLDFNLIQNSDGQVVGTYTSSLGGGGMIKGTVMNADFAFELSQTIENCPGIYKAKGVSDGNRIIGTYTGSDCLGARGNGTFTMTRETNSGPTSASHPIIRPGAQIPNEMRKSVGDFLVTRLLVWSEQDARTTMGDPLSHRYAYDSAQNVTGDIYTFHDPTLTTNRIELEFDSKTSRMTNVYLYPSRITTWNDCKKWWGKDVAIVKSPNGNKIYSYKNRHLNVFVDENDRVVSLGLY